jgi:phosphate transport system substrate-binding protein
MSKKVLWKKLLVGALATMVLGVTGLQPVMASGTLTMSGSTSVYPLAMELRAGYNAKFSSNQIDITIGQGGSGVGITQVTNGTVDIGNVSRKLKDSEIAQNLVATTIARDAIAIVVNPNNPVDNLTWEQVAGIYNGTITDWSAVTGGAYSGTIVVNSRETGSGTLDYFKEYFTGKGYTLNITTPNQYASNQALRSAVAGDDYAIGFLSMGLVNSTVKAPSLQSMVASQESANAGTYDFVRDFNMVTLGQPTGNEALFLTYVLSADGQAIVTQEYLAPSAGGSAAAAKGQVRATRQTRQVR